MKSRPRIISWYGFALAFPLMLIVACSDQHFMTAAMRPAPGNPNFVEYSDHFYQGSDGFYFWDGQPPPGDLSPATISYAAAYGNAPRDGTSGWVEGNMSFIGDQARLDVVYSVDSAGQPQFSNATASSGWKYRDFSSRGTTQDFKHSQSLPYPPMGRCDISLEVGGTAYARKAFPFGIFLFLIKFSISDLTAGAITWGETSRPLQAHSDGGRSCDAPLDYSCDRSGTPEIEPCPVAGDPANTPYGGGGSGEPTNVRGDYSGYSSPGGYVGGGGFRCVDWIDWWVSFDGGSSWMYDYRQCTEWAEM